MGESVLEICDVTKNFGNIMALDEVSFTIHKGEIVGLIGPNGAGKSTLVNLISGYDSWSSGDVLFNGRSLNRLKPHQIGSLGISRTFQVAQPLSAMSTFENILVGALFGKKGRNRTMRFARKKAQDISDLLGLSAKNRLPAESLNVPERKRLERARSLAMLPTLLLLDEVMAGLNPKEVDEAVEVIKHIRDLGVTILVVEHIMKAISKLSDRIVVVNHGEKITEGTPDMIFSNEQVVEAYLGKRYRQATA